MTSALIRSGLFGTLLQDPQIAACFGAEAMMQGMLAFESAWSKALRDTGLASSTEAEAALRAIADFRPDMDSLAKAAERDGLPVPALAAALKDAAGSGASAIHNGATSQDVVDTAMVLCLGRMFDLLAERINAILVQFDQLQARFGPRPLMGHTRMQAALPITVADRLQSWRAPFQGCHDRLGPLRAEALRLQYGGAIGTRSGVDGQGEAIAQSLSATLGLPPDRVHWHTDRSVMVSVGHWLTLAAGAGGKLGLDIALMAQQADGSLRLAGGGGSSAMPHKQNPILAETLVTLGRYVGGQQGVLSGALLHEQERSGSAWALEWMVLPTMAEATGASLRQAETLLGAITSLGGDPA